MFIRWKEVIYSQISIYQFFGRYHENRHVIACSKILGKMAVFCKSYKNTRIRVFLHAKNHFCIENGGHSRQFQRNMQKNRKKNICYHYFLFFVIFCISFKQNFLKPNESCFLDGKKLNIAKLVYINLLTDSMEIAMLQPVRKFSENGCFLQILQKYPYQGISEGRFHFCTENGAKAYGF